MNIAIYYHRPLYETRGGVGRVATWLARSLVTAGHRVWCFVPAGFKVDGITCMGVTCEGVETIEIPLGSIRSQHRFVKHVFKELNIEIVFNQCGVYKQSKVVLDCGARVITTHHLDASQYMFNGSIPSGYRSVKFRLLNLLNRFAPASAIKVYDYLTYRALGRIVRSTAAFTVLSQAYWDWFAHYYPQYKAKFRVISNPIPFTHENISDFQKKVLFVGRVDHEKRVERLLDVWSRLPSRYGDWELQIVGPGSELELMKNLVAEKKLANVVFTGRTDVRPYYSHASIICLTSDIEGVPMVFREAMSYGIAPIVYDSFSSAREMITDHINGRLIPAFDSDAYITALCELMDGEAASMRNAIIESSRPYSGDKIFAQWSKLMVEVMKGN